MMASEKPTMILLSKSDMSKEEISALSDAEAWKLIYSIRTVKAKDTRLQVCFTGFGTSKKQELINLANLNNFKVVSSVTQKLDFLCGDENAGPKKIEKAEAQGVQFLNESQFIQLIETGEMPQEK
jgi:NAD-dependent DNA ligase